MCDPLNRLSLQSANVNLLSGWLQTSPLCCLGLVHLQRQQQEVENPKPCVDDLIRSSSSSSRLAAGVSEEAEGRVSLLWVPSVL